MFQRILSGKLFKCQSGLDPKSGPDLGQKSFAKIINKHNSQLARVNTCADEFTYNFM